MPESHLPILLTKLHIPPARTGWVRRERLFERLAQAARLKGISLSAPAGYGKTALLAGWIANCQAQSVPLRFAWLSLDEGENDPVRFWRYCVAALQTCFPDGRLGKSFLDMLRPPQPNALEASLSLLINEILQVPEETILVLDDTQTIQAPEVLGSLFYFLEHLPENLHLILCGRSEMAVPLARLRAHGQLIDLGAQDLRFTIPEAEQFFSDCTALGLRESDVKILHERTEGWVAGLQLAALSMDGLADKQAFIHSFSGDDRHIIDYMVGEALSHQPKQVQDFLLRTSILERLCASLCDQMLAEPLEGTFQPPAPANAQATLETLEHSNLFLIPLDNRRVWYRYHRLFAELLQARFRSLEPGLIPEMQRRAAAWFAAAQFPQEAVQHALASGDLEMAAGLVRANLEPLLENGEVATLVTWLQAFPEEMALSHPELCLAQAWIALYQLHFEQVETWAQRAGDLLARRGETEAFPGQVEALLATAAVNFANYEQAIRLSRQALLLLPAAPRWGLVRSLINLNLGDTCSLRAEFSASALAYQDALAAAKPSGNPTLEATIIGSLGQQYLLQGRLRQAEAVFQQVFQVEKDLQGGEGALLAAGKPLAYLARVYIEWNQLEKAREVAGRALDYCKRWNHPDHLLDAYLNWAELCQLAGDEAGCQQALARAKEHVREIGSRPGAENKPGWLDKYNAIIRQREARLRYCAGDWPALERLLPEMDSRPDMVIHPYGASMTALVGYARLHAGRPSEVLRQARGMVEAARPLAWLRLEIEGWLLAALAEEKLGDARAAQEALGRALQLAEAEGYVRLFLDGGEDMRRLLEERRRSSPTAYVASLLEAFGGVPRPPAGTAEVQLSERERQVLRLLAAGLTNDEIAAELFLSTNTIKTHLKRIFEKAGVDNRIEAANVARERGWI
ncbi:MAG: LuxR C-terminal-related transcriptional regulator [Anaerolineales bacterium]